MGKITCRKLGLFAGVALAAAIVSSTVSAATSFEQGWQAYQKGDFGGALAQWKPLANNGDARALFNIGVMYDEGRGVAQSRNDAVVWWEKAAEAGNPHAKHNLGLAYLTGDGVEQNYDLAISWLGEAAGQGLIRSQYSLGKNFGAGLWYISQDGVMAF